MSLTDYSQIEEEIKEPIQAFGRETLNEDYTKWPKYRKKTLTYMKRVNGPFIVYTSEGPLHCDDGFLAIDAGGYPYPLAADVQVLIYEPA